jgi:hypothetical protein
MYVGNLYIKNAFKQIKLLCNMKIQQLTAVLIGIVNGIIHHIYE